MNLWFITMVKDEEDTIEGWIRHAASEGATGVAILNNGSTDGTAERITAARDVNMEIKEFDDPEVGYYQARKLTDLADWVAREYGAEWIVPADADEIWTAEVPLVEHLTMINLAGFNVAEAYLFNHYCTGLDDESESDPFLRLVWRHPEINKLPKIAFKWMPGVQIHQGNHGLDYPTRQHRADERLVAAHFPYRSVEHFIRKARNGAAAYAATDLDSGMGNHWREYGRVLAEEGEAACAAIFYEHFYFNYPREGMILDPAPYQRW